MPAAYPSPVVAVIADMIQSRRLSLARRTAVQHELETFLADVNRRYRRSVLAGFLVTLGDEFQGLLGDAGALPDIVQDARERLPHVRFRIAVGYGALTTPLRKQALGTDGPAWHQARALLRNWRLKKRDGVGFAGFGDDDLVLDGVAALITFHWNSLEASQRDIITTLRHHQGLRKDAARALAISQQNLSNRAQAAGAREYQAGIEAWRRMLQRHLPGATRSERRRAAAGA